MSVAKDKNDVDNDILEIIERPVSTLRRIENLNLSQDDINVLQEAQESEREPSQKPESPQASQQEQQDSLSNGDIDQGIPKSRVVSGLGRLGTANIRFVSETINLNNKNNKESENVDKSEDNTSFDNLRPSSKIRIFKGKLNLRMSNVNLNQVLPVEYPQPFEIVWSHINYKVRSLIRKKGIADPPKLGWKEILHDSSGYFCSGEVTAIMGPSGAGKSTLLEILAGRRRIGKISGHVGVRNMKQIRLAYVPQENHLMGTLTVEETLYFACKVQNLSLNDAEVKQRVSKVIEMFSLDLIRETFAERCSGGQQKRVSIACELFSKPNVLILDEPTTGLDSPSCATVTKLLRELVDNPHQQIAVVATIHQPPWNVFAEFHQVYVLSRSGSPIYLGSPTDLISRLQFVGYPCGRYDSPSDYIIEIAAGDHGDDAITKLVKEHQISMERPQSPISNNDSLPIEEILVKRKAPFAQSFPIILDRHWRMYRRKLGLNGIRIISIFAITIWLCLLFGRDVGKISGCPLRKLELYAIPTEKLSSLFEESILMVSQNACALFFGLMVGLISGMVSTVLEFPKEMRIFHKEYNNGWYEAAGFYVTKSILDIPMQLIIPSIYVVIMYIYTNQPRQLWRAMYLWYITIAVTFCAESVGAMSAAIFMEKPLAAAFVAAAIPLPMCMFGGLLVKYSRMPSYMQVASWTSLLKYAFEGIIIVMYGYDRCDFTYKEFLQNTNISAIGKPAWAQYMPMILNVLDPDSASEGIGFEIGTADPTVDEDEEFLKKIYQIAFSVSSVDTQKDREAVQNGTMLNFDRSLILSYFELHNDNILFFNTIIMTIYYFALKFVTYLLILLKIRRL